MEDMDRTLRGWLHNTAVANYWRVADWYELDDLIQDGAYFYLRIRSRYPNVTEPKNVMALFKVAFINHIHDLSKKKTRTLETRESMLDVNEFDIDEVPQDADTNVLLLFLPPVLRKLVIAMQTDPRMQRPCRRRHNHRETTNEKLARLIGIDNSDGTDLLESLRQYLSPDIESTQSPAV